MDGGRGDEGRQLRESCDLRKLKEGISRSNGVLVLMRVERKNPRGTSAGH